MQVYEVLDNCIDEVQGGHAQNVKVHHHLLSSCLAFLDFFPFPSFSSLFFITRCLIVDSIAFLLSSGFTSNVFLFL